MSEKTAIGWTDHTFNPWWGCTRVSQGCVHCYAETFAARHGVEWGPKASRRTASNRYWGEPLRWNEKAARTGAKRVFCGSMCDVFESFGDLDVERARLWLLISRTPNLDWLLLTKRPENIPSMLPLDWLRQPLPNVWLGTSVEDQETALVRIPRLLAVPAVVRFLSCEPLLGPVDLWTAKYERSPGTFTSAFDWGKGVNWVIAGGESGRDHRVMDLKWLDDLAQCCDGARVPLFVKQDSHLRPGQQGRISDALWARKAFPVTATPDGGGE